MKRFLTLTTMLLFLVSCNDAAMNNNAYKASGNGINAEDIDTDLGGKCFPNSDGSQYNCVKFYAGNNNNTTAYNKKIYLALLASDSQKKCDEFLKILALSENNVAGSNNVSSQVGNVASAIGKAAMPQIDAMNAVANASGINTGFGNKNSNSEAFARKNITNYMQAINLNYGSKIKQYNENINKSEEAEINVITEISNLQNIHKECSLNAAQNFINERLKQ